MRPLIGTRLSHYLILEKIGAGGMGEVYRAHDERLERDVALKVLPAGTLADDSARRRFRKEALALSKLNHPNIATIFDFDSQGGVDFLVMELISGETLVEKLRHGPLPEEEVARLGSELASGLGAAHAHGVIHRDLKPGNVRLTPDGRLKILDFGLARRMSVSDATTEATTLEMRGAEGTLPYMPPEQVRGESVDTRADIWAAGAVLYEMAMGGRAFPGEDAARVIAAILGQTPRPARGLRGPVSSGLEGIILRCLERNPESRYQSARELGADLSRLATGAPAALQGHGRLNWAPVVIAGVAVIALAAALVFNIGRVREMIWSGQPQIRSLAVLPLLDLSGNPENEYFADGMTDELITLLARIGALKVISRTSVMRFKNSNEPLPKIARALHVDAVLEGSVSRSGNRVRVTAQLIRAATDEHLWAQSYERDLRDVLALQSDVARAIASEIHIALTPSEKARLARTRTVDPEAHRAYLRGLYYWNKRTIPWIEKAIESFNQSIAIDPSYALPYSGIATCYAILPAYDVFRADDVYPKARAAALKALELDNSLAEPHAVLAGIKGEVEFDQKGAEAEFQQAIALNPNYASARHWHADLLSCLGRHEEALAEIKRAQELDPLSLIISTEHGGILARAGRIDQAIESLQKTIDMDPGFARAHQTLAIMYQWAGRYLDALPEFEKEDSLLGRRTPAEAAQWYGPLRRAYIASGEKGYYRQLLKQRMELARKKRLAALQFAVPYAKLGENDSAFAWLNRAREERDPFLCRINVEPIWNNLHSDPRYPPLLRSLGLKP